MGEAVRYEVTELELEFEKPKDRVQKGLDENRKGADGWARMAGDATSSGVGFHGELLGGKHARKRGPGRGSNRAPGGEAKPGN